MEIKLEDLWMECATCRGAGRLKLITGDPGSGAWSESNNECGDCKGKHGVITPAGEAVLAFMQKMIHLNRLRLS